MRNRDYKIRASWSELPQNSSFGQRPRRGRWPMAPPHTRIAPFFSLSLFFSSIPYGAPFGSSEATIQIPGESNDCNCLNNRVGSNNKYTMQIKGNTYTHPLISKRGSVYPPNCGPVAQVIKHLKFSSKPEQLELSNSILIQAVNLWTQILQIKNTKYNSWVEMHTTSKQFKVTPVLKKNWLASKPEHLGLTHDWICYDNDIIAQYLGLPVWYIDLLVCWSKASHVGGILSMFWFIPKSSFLASLTSPVSMFFE